MCKIRRQTFQGTELTVNPDETVVLNCSVVHERSARQIRWTKEGDKTNGQWLLNITSLSMPGLWSSLQLTNVSVEDSGKYKCEVKRDAQQDVCEVVIHVHCKLYFFYSSAQRL